MPFRILWYPAVNYLLGFFLKDKINHHFHFSIYDLTGRDDEAATLIRFPSRPLDRSRSKRFIVAGSNQWFPWHWLQIPHLEDKESLGYHIDLLSPGLPFASSSQFYSNEYLQRACWIFYVVAMVCNELWGHLKLISRQSIIQSWITFFRSALSSHFLHPAISSPVLRRVINSVSLSLSLR